MGRVLHAFSLVETLVAVAILTTGLTAALGLLSFSLRTVRVSGQALVAAHLAAEGVEIIRNLRDENWLRRDVGGEARAWRDGLGNGEYEVTYTTTLASALPAYAGKFLQTDGQGRYCYDCGGTPSPFTRKVTINTTDVDATKQMRVIATVAWQGQSGSRQVSVEEILYDWK